MTGAVTDQRLQAAHEGLSSGRYKVLSLDVFDTLLWRRAPEAPDVFPILGRRLAAGGKLAPHVSPLGFADLRRAAEKAAREKVQAVTGYREIKLADIYALLPDHVFAQGFDKAARISAELDCESSLLILDQDVAALATVAKKAGARVLLVSDTYFTSAELRGLLAAAGFSSDEAVDRIYVSCEAGKPKYRDLFDTILKDAGVPAAQVIHVGDTLEADINPCRSRGVAVAHYDKWSFSPRVRAVEFHADPARRAVMFGDHGDFGLTGLRSRLAHRPPASLAPELKPYWIYGAATLAPVFAGFSRWVVSQARANGITRILGIMREGRFLKRTVEATAQRLGVQLKVDVIWLSRRAVIRAALYADDMKYLPEAILLNPGSTTDEILAGLGVSRADLKGVLPDTYDVRDPNALGMLAQAILSTASVKEKALAVSAAHRANLLRGMAKHFDISKPDTVTLLDLGYAATIQAVLGQILKREGAATRFTGFYLALNEKAVANVCDGADLRAFLGTEGFHGMTAALMSRTPDVLEHACMCPEGSLEAYDAAGEPKFLPSVREDVQITQMEAVQSGILAGMEAIDGLLGGLDRVSADEPELKMQAAQTISALMLHPTAQEARSIGAWRHEANFDLKDVRRFTDIALDPAELEYRGWSVLQNLGRHQVYWPAAALQAVNPFLGGSFAAGLENAYRPDHLTAGPLLGGLTITPDLGAGFDAKRQGAVPLAVNAMGRCEIHIIVKPFGADAFRRLRFTWPAGRAVMQMDSVGMVYIGEGYRRAAGPGPMVWSGAREIAPGVYMGEGAAPAEVSVALDAPPSWPHALELTVRLKYLRLDRIFG